MSPVVCKPPRYPGDYALWQAEQRGRSKYAIGLLFCVLIALIPLTMHTNLVSRGLLAANPVGWISQVSEPAGRVASGDIRPIQRWVGRRSRAQLLLTCALGATAGVYFVMRR